MKNLVVVNPHDDDAVIAIGGTLIQLIEKGWKVKYIQLTDGRHGSNVMKPEKTKLVRAKEIQDELKFMKIDKFVTFDLEDGQLKTYTKNNNVISRLSSEISSCNPSIVFYPSECEDHSDHRAANEMALAAIKNIKSSPLMIRYTVWNIPFKAHNPVPFHKLLAIEIKNQMGKKKEAIKLHVSQEKEGHYSEMIESVNKYLALLYSAYKSYQLSRVELLAVTENNRNLLILENDLTDFKDVTASFHGRSSEKIES